MRIRNTVEKKEPELMKQTPLTLQKLFCFPALGRCKFSVFVVDGRMMDGGCDSNSTATSLEVEERMMWWWLQYLANTLQYIVIKGLNQVRILPVLLKIQQLKTNFGLS